jgi:hypothetical protein
MHNEPFMDVAHLGHLEVLTPSRTKAYASSSMCSG